MQRSVNQWFAIAFVGLGLGACEDLGVGDPCIPERIPTGGYDPSESYIESSSVQCRSRLCIVHQLDNGKGKGDPSKLCNKKPEDLTGDEEKDWDAQCVGEENLDESVYCTCRCDGPKTSVEFCECPGGYECAPILNLGGDGIKGSYCVRPKAE
jgi:hypothetical protein